MASPKREQFGSRLAVIFAMAGSAIGLGNIWRFPYMVGENGGGAFILLYAVATVLISLPVFFAEMMIGRRSRTCAYGAMSKLAPDRKIWRFAGVMAVIVPLVIASYYSVIGGWSLEFLFKSFSGDIINASPDEADNLFSEFVSSGWLPVIMHLMFMAVSVYIVANGVKSGIERFSKITIPALFVLIIMMIVYSVSLPDAMDGVKYLVNPDFSQINPRSFAYAMGQSFYSLSLGMGTIITYGSYVSRDENIVVSGVGTAVFDMLFALLAGFAIMPAVFAAGMEPGCGPGLVFQSVPFIFSTLGVDYPIISLAVSISFFLAIVVAAMTSLISLLEVGVSYLVEYCSMGRKRASVLLFCLCGGLGTICSLSLGPMSSLTVGGKPFFDFLDWISSNILLPILAMCAVIFVGFVLRKSEVRDELTNSDRLKVNGKIFGFVYFLIKWVAPVAVTLLFISNFII